MKKYLYLLALPLLLASCGFLKPKPMFTDKTTRHDPPYVRLNTGQVIKADEVQKKTSFLGADKIQVGDATYKAREVAFFSDGKSTYANVTKKRQRRKPGFAKKIADLNLNEYAAILATTTTTMNTGGHMGGSGISHTTYSPLFYVQQNDSSEVKLLTYKNVRPMIPANNNPGDKILKDYEHHNKVNRVMRIAGIGLLAGGVGLMVGSAATAPKGGGNSFPAAFAVGAGAFAVSFPVNITSIFMHARNSRRLPKAVDAYNTRKRVAHK